MISAIFLVSTQTEVGSQLAAKSAALNRGNNVFGFVLSDVRRKSYEH
jgi:hypothetical protein